MRVRIAVEEKHRTLAHESAERTIRFPGMKKLGIALKYFAAGGGIAGEDEWRD